MGNLQRKGENMKLKYHLDHPQIKRNKSWGNKSGTLRLGGTQTTGQKAAGQPAPKGSTGGTGNMKTNIGQLLGGGSAPKK